MSARGGEKLLAALEAFDVDPTGLTCADLGCNVGGFTRVLLERGASLVYAIDTGHGMLASELREDSRVVVMERTNALHVELPEPVDLVVIDVAWTPQRKILPAAFRLLRPGGMVVSLLKPHYEAEPGKTRQGVLEPEVAEDVAADTCRRLAATGFPVRGRIESPITGGKGNAEFLILLVKPDEA